MNTSKFNYFLKDNEDIRGILHCSIKALANFQMIEQKGFIIASDQRLIFCNTIGDHYNFIIDFDYSYITSLNVKETYDNQKYIVLNHNGDLVKITEILQDDINLLLNCIK